jgi:hypothetical protein
LLDEWLNQAPPETAPHLHSEESDSLHLGGKNESLSWLLLTLPSHHFADLVIISVRDFRYSLNFTCEFAVANLI